MVPVLARKAIFHHWCLLISLQSCMGGPQWRHQVSCLRARPEPSVFSAALLDEVAPLPCFFFKCSPQPPAALVAKCWEMDVEDHVDY